MYKLLNKIDDTIKDLLIKISISFKNLREAHDNSRLMGKLSETELRRRVALIIEYQDKNNNLKDYYEKEILLIEKNYVSQINSEFIQWDKKYN